MQPHAWFLDDIELRDYRHTIETVNSQCEKMGVERLYARTNSGFELKVLASIIALGLHELQLAIKVLGILVASGRVKRRVLDRV